MQGSRPATTHCFAKAIGFDLVTLHIRCHSEAVRNLMQDLCSYDKPMRNRCTKNFHLERFIIRSPSVEGRLDHECPFQMVSFVHNGQLNDHFKSSDQPQMLSSPDSPSVKHFVALSPTFLTLRPLKN